MATQTLPFAPHQLAALLLGLATLVAPASAQNTSTGLQREVDEAFREVIANAGSMDARVKYATLLVQAGNFEGGIAALEGLLLSPEAPASIRFELAVLYYRLGSYALSETYLREALADSRLDGTLKKQSESLLRDVERRNRPQQLSGSLMIGLRGQSNPTAASKKDPIYSFGAPVPRNRSFGPESDMDAQIWGKLDHVADLEKQNEAAIVTSLVGFANHFNSVDSYRIQAAYSKPFDLAILAGSTGLRFKPSPSSLPGLTLRPHLLFGSALANGHSFFSTGGAGLDGNYRTTETTLWGASLEQQHFTFSSRDDIVNAAQQSGNRQTLRLRNSVETGANRFLTTELSYIDHDGRQPYASFRGPEARISYVFSYAPPVLAGGEPWTTTLSGSALRREYRGADPAVDPLIARRDTEWRASLTNAIPLSRDTALHIHIEHTKSPANLPNYSYSNTAGTLGVIWKY